MRQCGVGRCHQQAVRPLTYPRTKDSCHIRLLRHRDTGNPDRSNTSRTLSIPPYYLLGVPMSTATSIQQSSTSQHLSPPHRSPWPHTPSRPDSLAHFRLQSHSTAHSLTSVHLTHYPSSLYTTHHVRLSERRSAADHHHHPTQRARTGQGSAHTLRRARQAKQSQQQ